MLDSLFGGTDRVGQFEGFFGWATQHVVGEPLGGLGADAGKTSQCGDQSINGGRVSWSPTSSVALAPGPGGCTPDAGEEPGGSPPVIDESDLAAPSRALTIAALTAAATRSSSSSLSASATSLGSIRTETTSSRPFDLHRDRAAAGGTFHLELSQRLKRFFERLAQLAGVSHQVREHSQLVEHGMPFRASRR